LGIAYEDKDLINVVLQVNDSIIDDAITCHTWEQIAFSYVLQHKTTIHESYDSVFHYRPNKAV
jgi:GTPase